MSTLGDLAGRRTLLDGAWATELQARGLALRACPDEWNLSHPAEVEAVARSYVDAGSQVILTNTFGANRMALSRHGLGDRVEELNRLGAQLSRTAAGARARVFAAVGPSGRLLATGQTSETELRAAFDEQARALAEEGVDTIVLETFSDLDELSIALAAVLATGTPAVACMVFDSGPEHDRTMTGTTPEEAVERLAREGAMAVGANCGSGVQGFEPICRRMRAVTDLPLWMKPNAGLPRIVDGRITYDVSPEWFGGQAIALFDAGATLVGGCCGTSPAFIRAMVRARSALLPPSAARGSTG